MNSNLPQGLPELLTVEEAAQYLRVPASFVYQRTRLGTIPTRRVGTRLVRIPRDELLAWIKGQ